MRMKYKNFHENFKIGSIDQLVKAIDDLGFIPFFVNEIKGFSLEEHVADNCWYYGSDPWEAWEWKGPAIRKSKCAYGKFMFNKAVYISRKWFPDFANYRRDGYDFDARYDDGLASRDDKYLYELLDENAPVLSKPLKALGNYRKDGRKGFDSSILRLQKQGYITISDFTHAKDKQGNEYGWGIAEYSTPEKLWGEEFTNEVYKRTPEESLERLVEHLKIILPGTLEEQLRKIIRR